MVFMGRPQALLMGHVLGVSNTQPVPVVICKPVFGKMELELVEDLVFENMIVPTGFQWNGQSVPCGLWWLAGSPFTPEALVASCVHDYLYMTASVSKVRADAIFYDLNALYGVPTWRNYMKLFSLLIFGRWAWNKCRKNDSPIDP